MKFGMPCTLKRAANSGYRSVSTFTTTALPAMSAAARATSGAAIRHGPHHAAQKSASTGTRASRMISSNDSGSTSSGSFTAGNGALQAPHLPASARCLAGTRFFLPQVAQVRTTGIATSHASTPHSLWYRFHVMHMAPTTSRHPHRRTAQFVNNSQPLEKLSIKKTIACVAGSQQRRSGPTARDRELVGKSLRNWAETRFVVLSST